MIRAIRPSAVARDDASLIGGWNIAPNVGYTISLSVSASAVVVILASLDGATLIGSGLALVGVDQPVTITPVSGQTISMVDADLGWHLLVTASGTEGERTITIDPMVDLADEIHPIYTDDGMALARATAAINAGACYVDDVSVACPLGLGAGIGGVASAPVDGAAVVGQVESVTWSGTPDGTIETAVIRRHTPIAPEAYVPPLPPPVLVDDTAETDAATATSGNVLTNDTGALTVSAVNGLSANVGEEIAGSAGGVFTIAEDGAWTFDPDGDFASLSGSDTATTSVSYHASNGSAEASATLTMTVSSSVSAPWTPANISTALWVSDASAITEVSGAVSQVNDLSPNGYHLTQSSSSAMPTAVAGALNGRRVLRFDGSNDRLLGPTGAAQNVLSGVEEAWSIAVVKSSTTSSGNRYYFSITESSNNNAQYLDVISSTTGGTFTNRPGIGGRRVTGTSYSETRSATAVGTNWHMALKRIKYSSATGVVNVDGGADESSAMSNMTAGVTNTVTRSQFMFGGYGTYFHNGDIAEFIFGIGTLTNDERDKLFGYLAHKWGLTTNLPPNHPYKNAAPTL